MSKSSQFTKKHSLWTDDSSVFENSMSVELLHTTLDAEELARAIIEVQEPTEATQPYRKPFDETCMATLVG